MREEKQLLLDDIKNRLKASQAVVVARYSKLEPNKIAGFRNQLTQTGGSLAVVKKRILLKASKEVGLTLNQDVLEGHIAVFFLANDPLSMTKAIYQFNQANENVLEVLSGQFEGAFCSAQDVEQISKLPSKDEMRAQLLSVLEAPLSQTLAVMDALLTSVVHCLENKSQENQ